MPPGARGGHILKDRHFHSKIKAMWVYSVLVSLLATVNWHDYRAQSSKYMSFFFCLKKIKEKKYQDAVI